MMGLKLKFIHIKLFRKQYVTQQEKQVHYWGLFFFNAPLNSKSLNKLLHYKRLINNCILITSYDVKWVTREIR